MTSHTRFSFSVEYEYEDRNTPGSVDKFGDFVVLTPPFSVNWTLGPVPFLTSNTAWNRNTLVTMHFNENEYNDDFYLRFWGLSHGRHDALDSLHDIDDYRKVVLAVSLSIEPSTTCTRAHNALVTSIKCMNDIDNKTFWLVISSHLVMQRKFNSS